MSHYSKKLYLFDYKEITTLVEFYFMGNSKIPKRHLSTFIKIVFFPFFIMLITALTVVCALYTAVTLLVFVLDYSMYVSFWFYPFVIPKFLVEIVRYFIIFLGHLVFLLTASLLRMIHPEKGSELGVNKDLDQDYLEHDSYV